MSEETDLKALIDSLVKRIASLETEVADLKAQSRIPEDHLFAIAAAVAAYTGYKGKVRAVRFSTSQRWAHEMRGRAHDRRVQITH